MGKDRKEFSISSYRSVIPMRADDFKLEMLNQSKLLPVGRVGRPYEAIIGHKGGAGKINWRVSDPRKLQQAGLTLKNGRITGVPDKPGKYEFSVGISFILFFIPHKY